MSTQYTSGLVLCTQAYAQTACAGISSLPPDTSHHHGIPRRPRWLPLCPRGTASRRRGRGRQRSGATTGRRTICSSNAARPWSTMSLALQSLLTGRQVVLCVGCDFDTARCTSIQGRLPSVGCSQTRNALAVRKQSGQRRAMSLQ